MNTWRDMVSQNTIRHVTMSGAHKMIFGPMDNLHGAINEMANILDEIQCNSLMRNIINELATNDDCPGILEDGWWQRSQDQIDKVTIHHTYGWHDVYAFSRSYVQKGGGRPSVPYTIWITATGEVLLCNELTEGCWHDHTGHENINLSVGLAGSLHLYRPPTVQLISAAKVCKWAIDTLPMVRDIDDITGHDHWYNTACPGWTDVGESKPSGEWKSFFYGLLEEML